MNPVHFLRMAHWARNPPSRRRVILVAVVIGACLALAGLEWAGLVPEGFGLESGRQWPKVQTAP